jgi:hypothetical protein
VNSASSSKESAQDLPQKRRTLSSGFSQYQHDPLAGRLSREGMAPAATAAMGGSAGNPLSGKLSCVVSKIHPLRQTELKERLLQWNTVCMRNRKQGETPRLAQTPGCSSVIASARASVRAMRRQCNAEVSGDLALEHSSNVSPLTIDGTVQKS